MLGFLRNKTENNWWGKIVIEGCKNPFLLTFILITLTISVCSAELEVVLVNKDVKSLNPGSSSNIVIMLINKSDKIKEVQLKVTTPESWNLITDYSSVMLGRNKRRIKVFSFYIPKMTEVGEDRIIIEAFDRTANESLETIEAPIKINPLYEMEINVLKLPEFVFAGDSVHAGFSIQNLSNTQININCDLFYETKEQSYSFNLKSEEQKTITYSVSTNAELIQLTRKSVNLNVKMMEDSMNSISKSSSFKIIPTKNIKFDAFNRFPITAGAVFINDNRAGEKSSAYIVDVRGKGDISPNKKLEFHLRGPDKGGNPAFGLKEEYYLKYQSPKLNFLVGDNNYRLSDLTESSRYARGIGAEYSFGKIKAGGYVNSPQFYPDVHSVKAFYSEYSQKGKLAIKAAYMIKSFTEDSTANLISLSNELNLFKSLKFNAEFASGNSDVGSTKAYKINARFSDSLYSVYANYINADKDFPGYFSDSRYLSAGFVANFIRNLSLNVSYESNNTNLALDTLYSNAPMTTNLGFAAMFRFKRSHIGLAMFTRKREDRLDPKLFHYEERMMRLSYQNRFKKWDINLFVEMGKHTNLLEMKSGELTELMKAYLSLHYQYSKNISFDAFIHTQNGKYYESDDVKSFYYGLSVNANLKEKLDINIEYQSNFELVDYYKDRSMVSARIRYEHNPKNLFSIGANYNLMKNTLNQKELGLVFNYSRRLNIPISKKKNIGSLKGVIINKGVDKVEGLMISVNGLIALTDNNGFFEFSNLKSGKHYLILDDTKLELKAIAEKAGPYELEVIPGETTHFELAVTKSASVYGQFQIIDEVKKGDKQYVPVKEELGRLIIELKKESEVYRIYSDENGRFVFEDLRIGLWKLKIYEVGLPSGYRLMQNEMDVNLSSGESKELIIQVKKKSRKIKFQRKFK